jgi:hypothetical protein
MLGHRLGTTVVAIVAAALPLVACSGGDDDAGGDTATTQPPETTTSVAPTTTLSPEEQAEADVRAAYDAYWAMSERLAAAPDPQDPEIAERTTGDALDSVTTLLTQFLTQGRTVSFLADYSHDVLSVDIDETSALVRDCYVDHAAQIDAETGDVVLEATATLHLEVTLVSDSGAWKVSDVKRLDAWEGIVQCE